MKTKVGDKVHPCIKIGQYRRAYVEEDLAKAEAELAKLKAEREKLEVLAYHTGEGPRQWYTVSSWLRKGQTIVLMDALPPPPAEQEDSHETKD